MKVLAYGRQSFPMRQNGKETKLTTDSAHKNPWVIAEVVFGIPFLISIAINYFIPISSPQGILKQAIIPLGIVLLITGIGLVVLARREFAQYGQPTDPGHPTGKIVKTGIFAVSRNPLYLGSVLIFLGIDLMFYMAWAFVMLLVSIVLCHLILIIPEEKYLAAKFGNEYKEYTASVHRWLGRK